MNWGQAVHVDAFPLAYHVNCNRQYASFHLAALSPYFHRLAGLLMHFASFWCVSGLIPFGFEGCKIASSLHRTLLTPSSCCQGSEDCLCLQSIKGGDLWNRLYFSFGYLGRDGYLGHKYPIIIAETGSKFEAAPRDPAADVRFMSDFASWLKASNPATGQNRQALLVRLLLRLHTSACTLVATPKYQLVPDVLALLPIV